MPTSDFSELYYKIVYYKWHLSTLSILITVFAYDYSTKKYDTYN